MMTRNHHLAELQLAIMQILWDRGEATVAEVRQTLQPERELAHTTVGTMLAKLEEAGRVTHRSDGRVNIYRPLIKREQVTRSMVSDLAERLFKGDLTEMFCHLLDSQEVTAEEIHRLKKLIRSKERELKDGA
ncbi:MAG: BlaI/MecI/CopY family transcriptional regulator [Planctomycetaceae bacterium]|nr:BlaI/MecI/CopY family transcriptional regulator [Planctomycetaceae bacterium]